MEVSSVTLGVALWFFCFHSIVLLSRYCFYLVQHSPLWVVLPDLVLSDSIQVDPGSGFDQT